MAVFQPTYTDQKTGERKTSRVWWYEFVYANRRIRESAKTTRKTIAVEAEKRRKLELERANAGLPVEQPKTRITNVRDVVSAYQSGYKVNHRPKSLAVVNERAAHLDRLLGSVLIPSLTEERVLAYMRHRQEEGASGRTINLEVSVLSRAIGRTWSVLWPRLKRLEENRDVGRAIEPEEETALLEAAARNKSHLIHPFLTVLVWTGMRSDEARTLRWSRVDFEANQVIVGRAKTEAGSRRVIPMSRRLRTVLEQHASWSASTLGTLQPDWYVFPRCDRIRPIDPTRPVLSLKRAWEGVQKKAQVECRLHDLRHSFCTKMAEAGVPESTMLDMMGHVSAAMLRRYSHIRSRARRDAIDAIELRSERREDLPKEVPKVNSSGFPN